MYANVIKTSFTETERKLDSSGLECVQNHVDAESGLEEGDVDGMETDETQPFMSRVDLASNWWLKACMTTES